MKQKHEGTGDNIGGSKITNSGDKITNNGDIITYINNNYGNTQDSETLNLSPIKGLLAFDSFDTELFKSLERQSDIKGLRNALLAPDYKIGLLVGESGCGKTSLLKAGLAPELKSNTHICVVATLTNEDPTKSIHTALRTQSNTIVNEYYKAQALHSIAASMAKAKTSGYQAVFAQALTAANAIVDEDSKADALQSVASAMAEAKEFTQALAVANTIVGEYPKAEALQNIIENLVKANHYKEAYELVLNIPDTDVSKSLLLVYLSNEWNKWLEKQNYLTILSTNIIPPACG